MKWLGRTLHLGCTFTPIWNLEKQIRKQIKLISFQRTLFLVSTGRTERSMGSV